MQIVRRLLLPILLATVWISFSEFARNEFLLKSQWVAHYAAMGLDFPGAPVNGAVWGLWSLLFALVIYLISRRFTFWEAGDSPGWQASC
ncbi:MAG: hypothetical protein D6722_24250 [Bacteroidetes bacterium]|nr:MAG: hypothetical protein D6722_24250 [Bacteroidota bacterium]